MPCPMQGIHLCVINRNLSIKRLLGLVGYVRGQVQLKMQLILCNYIFYYVKYMFCYVAVCLCYVIVIDFTYFCVHCSIHFHICATMKILLLNSFCI